MPRVRLTLCGFQLNRSSRRRHNFQRFAMQIYQKSTERNFGCERGVLAFVIINAWLNFRRRVPPMSCSRTRKIIIFAHKKVAADGFFTRSRPPPPHTTHTPDLRRGKQHYMNGVSSKVAGRMSSCVSCITWDAIKSACTRESELNSTGTNWLARKNKTLACIFFGNNFSRSQKVARGERKSTHRGSRTLLFLHIAQLGMLRGESLGGLIKYCVQHSVEQSCLYQVAKSLLPTYKIHSSNFSPWKLIQAKLLWGCRRRACCSPSCAACEFDAGFCPGWRCSHFPGLSDCHQLYESGGF